MMLGYHCITCKEITIKRPIKENELIMSGKTRCPNCGEWIIYFTVIINE